MLTCCSQFFAKFGEPEYLFEPHTDRVGSKEKESKRKNIESMKPRNILHNHQVQSQDDHDTTPPSRKQLHSSFGDLIMAVFHVPRWIQVLTLLQTIFANPLIDSINSCKTYKNPDEDVTCTSEPSSKAMTTMLHSSH